MTEKDHKKAIKGYLNEVPIYDSLNLQGEAIIMEQNANSTVIEYKKKDKPIEINFIELDEENITEDILDNESANEENILDYKKKLNLKAGYRFEEDVSNDLEGIHIKIEENN